MTPDKLREWAADLDNEDAEDKAFDLALWGSTSADQLRAHAAALEEIERLKGELAIQRDEGEAQRILRGKQRERAEQAERRAERLERHAEAMAAAIERSMGYVNAAKAYRADKGE